MNNLFLNPTYYTFNGIKHTISFFHFMNSFPDALLLTNRNESAKLNIQINPILSKQILSSSFTISSIQIALTKKLSTHFSEINFIKYRTKNLALFRSIPKFFINLYTITLIVLFTLLYIYIPRIHMNNFNDIISSNILDQYKSKSIDFRTKKINAYKLKFLFELLTHCQASTIDINKNLVKLSCNISYESLSLFSKSLNKMVKELKLKIIHYEKIKYPTNIVIKLNLTGINV